MKKQVTFITGRRNMVDGTPQLTIWRYIDDRRFPQTHGMDLFREYLNVSPSSVKRMRRALDDAIETGIFEERINIWGTRRYERVQEVSR